MRILPLFITISLAAPLFLTNADSKTYETDKVISMEIISMESEGSEQAEILEKFNKLSFTKQQRLIGFLIIKNKADVLEYLIEPEFNIDALTKGMTLLHLAISRQNIEAMKVLIKKGASLERKDKSSATSLHHALLYKNLEIIKLLVENGANLNAKNQFNDTPLIRAIEMGHIDIVDYLIKQNAYTNSITETRTLFKAAFKKKDIKVIELMLKHGIEIPDGALHLAIKLKDLEIIKVLVSNGADLEFRDGNEETALKSAVRTDRINILEYLIAQGADVNASGKSDTSPITTAAYEGNKEVIQLLVKNGADIHHKSEDNHWTLLHYAAKYNHAHLIDFLIESGIDVDSRSRNGWSALATASDNGDIETVEKLLNHKADIELPTINNKTTPLMAAAVNGHTKVVNRLIKAGADFERKNIDGHNPLWLAANKSHTKTVKALLNIDTDHNQVFFDASSKGKFELVRTLIKSGIDVSARTKKGSTAMHLAARYGHLDIVKLLQKNGADIHALSTNKNDTPLMRAAGWGQRNVIDYLISQDTEVDIQTKHGWTAALSTARHHKLDTLKLFIEHGADIRKTTNSGWTILMLAAKGKKHKTMEFLLQQDLDLNLKNNKGHTALDIAIKSKDKKIIEMLKKASASKDLITST